MLHAFVTFGFLYSASGGGTEPSSELCDWLGAVYIKSRHACPTQTSARVLARGGSTARLRVVKL